MIKRRKNSSEEASPEQAKLTLECLRRVIEETGASIEDVVSCRVFLQQLTEANFAELNQAYREFFGANLPARTTIGCQLLNIDVEIDCVVNIVMVKLSHGPGGMKRWPHPGRWTFPFPKKSRSQYRGWRGGAFRRLDA